MIAQLDREMLDARPSAAWVRLLAYVLFEGRPLTTRGQWINPLVFANYRLAAMLPGEEVLDPIYIVGTGRSGTTILGKLFSVHREAMFLNEPKALWHFAHGDEDIIGSYSAVPGRLLLDAAEASDQMRDRISRTYRMALALARRSRVVDKYPELVFRVPLTTKLFPRSRFVAIVRDGVDTVASVENWSRRKGVTMGKERHDWWGRDDRKWQTLVREIVPLHDDLSIHGERLAKLENHLDRAAVEWIISMRAAAGASDAFPEYVHMTKYEELCANPEHEIASMLTHCGLPEDEVMIRYAKNVLTPTKPRQMELANFLLEPFLITLDAMGYGASKERVTARQTV